uniref:YncE family protein n=1 Tax=Roseburia sp. TaxID=2049040 RepID=UPI003FEF7DA6
MKNKLFQGMAAAFLILVALLLMGGDRVRTIDNLANVENYNYKGNYDKEKAVPLKACDYSFWETVLLPGTGQLSGEIADFCVQGLAFTPDYLLLTAYALNAQENGGLYVYDRKTGAFLGKIPMRRGSHLGGIAYGGKNVWVCHSGERVLSRISYKALCGAVRQRTFSVEGFEEDYPLDDEPSCLTEENGRLFAATFRDKVESRMTAYRYDENRDRLVAENVYQIPPKVQGVAFDAAGNVWFSTSYGRKNSSFLLKYKALAAVGEEGVQPEAVVELPPCSEELAAQNGKLYIVFESACRKYKEGTDGRGKSRSPLDKILLLEKFSEI